MHVKLLTEHHLEFGSLNGGCTGSSESIHVKMPHCWKSHVTAHIHIYIYINSNNELTLHVLCLCIYINAFFYFYFNKLLLKLLFCSIWPFFLLRSAVAQLEC